MSSACLKAALVKCKIIPLVNINNVDIHSQASSQTTGDQVPLSATSAIEETSTIHVVLPDDNQTKSIPFQLSEQNANTTHRTVTPVLPSLEKTLGLTSERLQGYSKWELPPREAETTELFSPMSNQFLVPPDYEAVFSGHQTLRVSECSQDSVNDMSPESPVFSASSQGSTDVTVTETQDFEFSPGFKKVLSDFEKTVSDLESEELKGPPKDPHETCRSPQQSDSDGEFFDCKQVFSDHSESEEAKVKLNVAYHITEPPSPLPGSSPNTGFLSGHPFLQVEDYKHCSSGSESLGEFAYDSDASREGQPQTDLATCEELPPRGQAEYYDDDDFLGRVRG